MRGVALAPSNPCSSSNMEIIISKAIRENDIAVKKDDPVFLKYFHMRVTGHFNCKLCGNKWTCYNATNVIDIHKREVSRKYKQFCRSCRELCDELWFTNKQF